MFKEIVELINIILKIVFLVIFSWKFLTGDMNEVKTIYYGILVLAFLM